MNKFYTKPIVLLLAFFQFSNLYNYTSNDTIKLGLYKPVTNFTVKVSAQTRSFIANNFISQKISRKNLAQFTTQQWKDFLKDNGIDLHPATYSRCQLETAREHAFNQLQFYEFESYRDMLKTIPGHDKQMARLARAHCGNHDHEKYNFQIDGKSIYHYINKEAGPYIQKELENWHTKQAALRKEALANLVETQDVLARDTQMGRQKASQYANDYNAIFFTKYVLNSSTLRLLNECSIDPTSFTDFNGNQLQHQLQCELIDSANNASDLYYSTKSQELKDYCKGVAYAAEAGCKANQLNQTERASLFSDFCQHATAFGRGVLSSCGNNIHAIKQALLHPFDTVSEIAIFAKNATLSLAKAVINHDIVQEYERMELYGLDIENMEGYKCAKEQLEQTYKTIDTYIEAAINQSSEEFCENLGYILTDAALYLYGPKGAKVAKNNFNKAIESGKKFFANFGEIGTESAKIVGLAGTEGVYRVEEALSILKQEGQVAKPKKLFGQVEKTVEATNTTVKISESALASLKPSNLKSKLVSELRKPESFLKNKAHMFHEKHNLLEVLGSCEQSAYNKLVDIVERVESSGLLKDGNNQILALIDGCKVEIRLNIHESLPRRLNAFNGWTDTKRMHNSIIIN